MRRSSLAVAVLMMVAAVAAAERPAFADEGTQDTGRLVATKFFRGIVNAATGWMEIPKQMIQTSQTSGAAKGWTWGFAKGIGFAVARSVMGAYEIITFPIPAPEGYRAVMHPEYVLSDLPENPQPR